MKIKKLENQFEEVKVPTGVAGIQGTVIGDYIVIGPKPHEIVEKINELIDEVNKLKSNNLKKEEKK